MKLSSFEIDFPLNPKDGYKLVNSKFVNNYYMRSMASYSDRKGNIPAKIMQITEELFKDDDYVTGIYLANKTDIFKIFSNGIVTDSNEKNGELKPSVEEKVNFHRNGISFLDNIKESYDEGYTGAIIVRIPRTYIQNYTIRKVVKPIFYINDNDECCLLPEFIYGYMTVDKDSNIVDFVGNPKYSDKHTYSNKGLINDNVRSKKLVKNRSMNGISISK